MALYAIGDLHLSLGVGKPMDIFGANWENHHIKIKENWNIKVNDDDTVVICGDISWAMTFEELILDFKFIHELKGKKIIVKGNHDYWWTTVSKMNKFLDENSFDSIKFLHNNSYEVDKNILCGTRGWAYDEIDDGENDKKVLSREVGRLKASIEDGVKKEGEIIVFLHYPPLYEGYYCDEIMDVLKEYDIKKCCYGHLHDKAIEKAIIGEYKGIEFNLVSCDYLNFNPFLII